MKLRHGKIVREGFHTTLTDLRLRKNHKTARQRWQQEICSGPALFIVGRDRSKLGWFWRHAYEVAQCGRYQGSVVNPDTGCPVYVGDERLLASDFNKVRLSEIIGGHGKDEDNDKHQVSAKPLQPALAGGWAKDPSRGADGIHRSLSVRLV